MAWASHFVGSRGAASASLPPSAQTPAAHLPLRLVDPDDESWRAMVHRVPQAECAPGSQHLRRTGRVMVITSQTGVALTS